MRKTAHGLGNERVFVSQRFYAKGQRPLMHGLRVFQITQFPIDFAQRETQLSFHLRLFGKFRSNAAGSVVQNLF